ncbi:MAG: menaquinone biosynthesis decarboxylase, partial [Epsilonproteobacteria bacterium]|nr:menaquinone biosynthesis decarboxylase [Campylobacterota bacterium]NPA57523.1 menaquinone biosynthesis decarboxylase [Campylobacterota bacterium]
LGWGTERIFLPLLRTTASDLIDYHMPENGVFHNLILAKMEVRYPAHAKQFMHAFWGVGQMSFVKHAIFLSAEAPPLVDYEAVTRHILDRISPERIMVSEGVLDHLDHSSPQQFEGGKIGIDVTGEPVERRVEILDDGKLLRKLQERDTNIVGVKQYFTESSSPVAVVAYRKERSVQELFDRLSPLEPHLAILVVVNEFDDLENPYMVVWRVTNNIDGKRDLRLHPFIMVDGTNKDPEIDNFPRQWPPDVVCDREVIEKLREQGIIDVGEDFIKKWGIL